MPGLAAVLRLLRPAPRPAPRAGARDSALLPFNLNAPARAQLAYAHASGIAAAARPLSGAILNYHLQLAFPLAKLEPGLGSKKVTFLPHVQFLHYEALGYFRLATAKLEREWLRREGPLREELMGALERGRYLWFNRADEYYVPGTGRHRRRHYPHDLLLVGFDRPREEFAAVVYDSDGRFTRVRLGFRALVKSLRRFAPSPAGQPDAVRVEIEPTGEHPGAADPRLIREQLRDYAAGAERLSEYESGRYAVPYRGKSVPHFVKGPVACGTAVYPLFQAHFRQCLDRPGELDLRATRVLAEHKKMVLAAVEAALGQARMRPLAGALGRVAALAESIHLHAFAFRVEADGEVGRKLGRMLEDLAAAERAALGPVLAALDRL